VYFAGGSGSTPWRGNPIHRWTTSGQCIPGADLHLPVLISRLRLQYPRISSSLGSTLHVCQKEIERSLARTCLLTTWFLLSGGINSADTSCKEFQIWQWAFFCMVCKCSPPSQTDARSQLVLPSSAQSWMHWYPKWRMAQPQEVEWQPGTLPSSEAPAREPQ
jgi:hypothetical protein